jgi:hypothetical protein
MNVYDVRNEFQGGYTTPRTSTRYIIVHHAAALYSPSAGLDDVRAVARYHTVDRGWPGIGYHIALAEETQGGAIARYNLSAENLQRAHILGRNDEALGIACLTNFTALPAKKWIDALVLALRDLRLRYPFSSIVGHKEVTVPGGETSCPGPLWHQWKPSLLAAVNSAGEPHQPAGTFPVHPALKSYYDRSGGLWQPDRYALGHAISELDPTTKVQKFERGALRLKPDGTIDALLRSEW